MSISSSDAAILFAPFMSHEHEFKNGFIYITEEAVCQRIELVDLSWEWHVSSVTRLDPKAMIATTTGHLTILGVTRGGEGSQMAEYRKGTDIESGEIEKGSETDALKRAARKFGIGRYLLQCPKEVKDYGPLLNKWLASLKGNQGAPNLSQDAPSRPQETSATSERGPQAKPGGASIKAVLDEYAPFMTSKDFEAMRAQLREDLKTGIVNPETPAIARTMIENHFSKIIDMDALRTARKEMHL